MSERSLAVLRALVDAVDHEVLGLLSRRNGLVAEIAATKREHRVPIRDERRERELLGDRRERAVPLGLSPDVVEGLFRLILWASRDRQAALRAEVPIDFEPRSVAVIGGKGAMGRCAAEIFADLGHAVLVADLDTELTPEEAARAADVVVISVPLDVTVEVIRHLGPLVRADALLMDVSSTKVGPVAAMLESTPASVVGAHPLFGPSVHSFQGQRVVLTRGRGDEAFDWVSGTLRSRGLEIVETTAADHDRIMAVVQVLTHFATETLGIALAELGVPIEETLRFTSPVYLVELLMLGRHFAQSGELYACIQMSNPDTERVTRVFTEAADRLRTSLVNQDRETFRRVFQQVREFLGPFTEDAREQSSYLIDRLVERS